MFYKGLIFDLDNTLYSYTDCHNFALDKCINYISTFTSYSYEKIIDIYNEISFDLKNELQIGLIDLLEKNIEIWDSNNSEAVSNIEKAAKDELGKINNK